VGKVGRHVMKSFLALAVAMSLVACASRQSVTVTLVEAQSGSTVQLEQDDTLVVELETMPTTGFTWEVDALDGAVVQQKGDPEYKGGEPGLVGGSGRLIFTFKAVGRGQTSLDMVYHQPWDPDTPPARTFHASVEVK